MGNKIIKLISFLIIFIVIQALSPVNVQSADTVKLRLNGVETTSWAVSDIMPGDSGKQTISLQNSGSTSGTIIIWISDILNTEGTNPESETGDTAEPGELGNYLLFNILSNKLSTNILMPSTIQNLPKSASASNYLKLNPLNAGETISLDWRWQLPAETENDIQGDRLSFTINYTLVPFTEPSPTGIGGGRSMGTTSGGGGASPKKTPIPTSLQLETPQPDPPWVQDLGPAPYPITITILYPELSQIPAFTPVPEPGQTTAVPAAISQRNASSTAKDNDLRLYNIFASISLISLTGLLIFLLKHNGRITN
jgi:hypothetical protein